MAIGKQLRESARGCEKGILPSAHQVGTPQHTKWGVTVEPDTMKPGPWNTTIYFGSDGNEEVWKLSLNDNIGANFKWLSDKLVFGSAWWGRIYATDFILDLDNHKFIYREMAQYGDMIQPCQ